MRHSTHRFLRRLDACIQLIINIQKDSYEQENCPNESYFFKNQLLSSTVKYSLSLSSTYSAIKSIIAPASPSR